MPLGIKQNNNLLYLTLDVWQDLVFLNEQAYPAGYFAANIMNQDQATLQALIHYGGAISKEAEALLNADRDTFARLLPQVRSDVSALLGGDAPPRSRGNLRRAVWFALALLGAALACRLPLPYLAERYQRTYIMWPYQLYLLLLRPLLWALGGWTLIAALHAFPGIPPMAGRPRRVLFWCGLAWCLVWLLLPLLGFVLSSLPVYLSLVWILRAPWIHLPGAIAMALGALKGRQ